MLVIGLGIVVYILVSRSKLSIHTTKCIQHTPSLKPNTLLKVHNKSWKGTYRRSHSSRIHILTTLSTSALIFYENCLAQSQTIICYQIHNRLSTFVVSV